MVGAFRKKIFWMFANGKGIDEDQETKILDSVRPETRIFVRDQGMRKILPQAYN